uniref:Uncharacterized protein n=1 Tax=Panagrolaimus sp. ES5 TaxID=591445 RepID=A0AC34FRT5_9BILA
MSSSKNEFKALITTFGKNSFELEELSYNASQAIVDFCDQEDITHQEVRTRFREICEAEYYRLKNADIQVENLPPQIDIENFKQKLHESKMATLEKKKREKDVQQKIEEQQQKIEELEETLRKKLEIINSAKELLH